MSSSSSLSEDALWRRFVETPFPQSLYVAMESPPLPFVGLAAVPQLLDAALLGGRA